jgi:hypothetical protein
MRILILAALAAAAPAASAPAPAVPAAPGPPLLEPQPLSDADCARRDFRPADAEIRPELKRLDELPAGDTILAVYNEVDGCMEPVIVGYGTSRDAAPPAPEPVRPRPRLYPAGS